jgi:Glycosyl transferase family 90
MEKQTASTPSVEAAIARIFARVDDSFVQLERNGTSASKADAFEAFLTRSNTLKRESLIVRCRFDGQDFHIKTIVDKAMSRPRILNGLLPCLKRIEKRLSPHFDVFMLISDTMYMEESSTAEFIDFLRYVPFLRPDWLDGDPTSSNTLTIPDFFMQERKYANEVAAIERAASRLPFEQRKDVFLWRGGLSGPDYPDTKNCMDFPRYHLLLQALRFPEKIDARLTHYENLAPTPAGSALRERFENWFGGLAPFIPMADFTTHKYLVSLDGVCASWKRVAAILWTGSVLLMQNRWQQFFYPGLAAWENYVPIANDVSDLATRFTWLQENPAHAASIAHSGADFARHILTATAVDNYMCVLLNRCSQLRR